MKRSEVQVLLGPPGSLLRQRRLRTKVRTVPKYRGLSSVGRAPALQAGGQGFDPPSLHKEKLSLEIGGVFCLIISVQKKCESDQISATAMCSELRFE